VTSGLIIRQDARVGSQLDTNGSWFAAGTTREKDSRKASFCET